jgi:hypothetical protein
LQSIAKIINNDKPALVRTHQSGLSYKVT